MPPDGPLFKPTPVDYDPFAPKPAAAYKPTPVDYDPFKPSAEAAPPKTADDAGEMDYADYWRAVKAGTGKLVQGAGQGAGWLGMPETKQSLQHYGEDVTKRATEEMTPAARAELAKTYTEEDPTSFTGYKIGPALKSPRAMALGVAQSVPAMAATAPIAMAGTAMLPEAAVAGLGVLGASVLGRVGVTVGAQAVPKLGAAISGALMGGSAEGLVQAGMTGQEVEETILKTPPEIMQASPIYQALLKEAGGDADRARQMTATKLANEASVRTGIATAALGAPAGALTGTLARGFGKSALGSLGKEAGLEMIQEGTQSPADQIIQNMAQRQVDPSVPLTKGAVEQAVAGGVLGGAMGAGMGAGAHGVGQRLHAKAPEDTAKDVLKNIAEGKPADTPRPEDTPPEAAPAPPGAEPPPGPRATPGRSEVVKGALDQLFPGALDEPAAAAPEQQAPAPATASTIDAKSFAAMPEDASGHRDMTAWSDGVRDDVRGALDRGAAVTLHIDGKQVPIVGADDSLRDATGQPWGLMPIAAQPPDGANRIEIVEPTAPAEKPVPETTPEPPRDIAAQVEAMADQNNPKDAVFVAKGNEDAIPASLPEGVVAVARDEGTLLTNNPEKAAEFESGPLTDAKVAEVLNIPETKEHAIASGEPRVVQGKDAQGNVVKEIVASPEGEAAARDAIAPEIPAGGTIQTISTIEAQQRRAALADEIARARQDYAAAVSAINDAQNQTDPKLLARLAEVEKRLTDLGEAVKPIGPEAPPPSKPPPEAEPPPLKWPVNIVEFITDRNGPVKGINDIDGILKRKDIHKFKGFVGQHRVVNPNGKSPSVTKELVEDAGYLPEDADDDALYDAIEKTVEAIKAGNPGAAVYTKFDQDIVEANLEEERRREEVRRYYDDFESKDDARSYEESIAKDLEIQESVAAEYRHLLDLTKQLEAGFDPASREMWEPTGDPITLEDLERLHAEAYANSGRDSVRDENRGEPADTAEREGAGGAGDQGRQIGAQEPGPDERAGTEGPTEGVTPPGAAFQTAYHGSPHEVDRFSTEKVGTGEGAAAYGWGLYFAGKKKIAEFYKNQLGRGVSQPGVGRVPLNGGSGAYLRQTFEEFAERDGLKLPDYFVRELHEAGSFKRVREWNPLTPHSSESVRETHAFLDALEAAGWRDQKGRLYTVDIAPTDAQLLDYDKPLSEQSEEVSKALEKIPQRVFDDLQDLAEQYGINAPEDARDPNYTGGEFYKVLERAAQEDILPGDFPFDSNKEGASRYLASLGIPGLRYLDADSRSNAPGEKTRNYVIFDDKAVKILEAEQRAQLAPMLTGDVVLSDTFAANEAAIAKRVDAIARKMIPGARLRSARRLEGEGAGEVYGAYYTAPVGTDLAHIIAWSLRSPDPTGTVRHEGIHYLRRAGFISPTEWGVLKTAAETGGWLAKHQIEERYPDLSHDLQIEEAVAEEFAGLRQNQFKSFPAALAKILQWLDLLQRRIAAVAHEFFGKNATADDVFTRVETGEVGARARAGDTVGEAFQKPTEPTSEMTDQGEQIIVPGTEHATQQEVARKKAVAARARVEQAMKGKKRSLKPQAGEAGLSLFGDKGEQINMFPEETTAKQPDPDAPLPPLAQGTLFQKPQTKAQIEAAEKARQERAASLISVMKAPLRALMRTPPMRLLTSGAGFRKLAESTAEVKEAVIMSVAPMAAGGHEANIVEARAAAKTFMNDQRWLAQQFSQLDDMIKRLYTHEERALMGDALDEQSAMTQSGIVDKAQGLGRLTPDQLATVTMLNDLSKLVWRHMYDAGLVQAEEGLPFYMAREFVRIGLDGIPERILSNKGEGSRPIDTIGANLTTAGVMSRKYVWRAETEAAGKKALGDDVRLVSDIRTLIGALYRNERAVAGVKLVNGIKEMGNRLGIETVTDTEKPDTFTIDHPALKVWRPKLEKDADGKWHNAEYPDGRVAMERTSIHINKQFEGPLRAVLNRPPGAIYKALMSLKSGVTQMIMISPVIHLSVEFGRALPLMPGKVATLRVFFDGNRMRKLYDKDGKIIPENVAFMRRMHEGGMSPIGRNWMSDITGIAAEPGADVGKSVVARSLGAVAGMAGGPEWNLAVRRGVDKAGDFWHGTLLWDRIADLQAGIAYNMEKEKLGKGWPPEAAAAYAAHLANRYAGALPQESMSNMARAVANIAMFSRTFTLGNIGVMKDMMNGLPRDVRAKLEKEVGPMMADAAKSAGRRKAISAFVIDVALFYGMNASLQAAFTGAGVGAVGGGLLGGTIGATTGASIAGGAGALAGAAVGALAGAGLGYDDKEDLRRWKALMERVKESPIEVLNPFQMVESMTPQGQNESNKRDRILEGVDSRGRGIYLRNALGKIGEEFIGYMTHPLEMLKRKQSTLVGPLREVIEGRDSFGRELYDKHDATTTGSLKAAAAIAGHMLQAQLPLREIQGVSRWMTDEPQANLELSKALLPFITGMTISSGHPLGPRGSEIAKLKDHQHQAVMKEASGINNLLLKGKLDEAYDKMITLGLEPKQATSWMNSTLNPAKKQVSLDRWLAKHASQVEQERIAHVNQ